MMPGCPVKLSNLAVETRIAPTLGQHTDEVLKDLLNYGDEELAELRDENLIK